MTLNFNKKTIELTAAEARVASKIGTEEYNKIIEAKNNFPNFTIEIIKSKRSKSSYDLKGLNYNFIKNYILNHGTEDQMLEFDIMCHGIVENGEAVGVASYGEIKKWFLDSFPEILAASKSKTKRSA